MRPITMSTFQSVDMHRAGPAGAGKDQNIQASPPEGEMGTAEAREAVAQLCKKLLPSQRISRSQFLNLPSGEREHKHVDLRTMVSLIIGARTLDKSMSIRATNHKSSAAASYHDVRELMIEFSESQAPTEGESDILREAKLVSYTQSGRCGLHAARNFALIGSLLHELHDDYPMLRDYLPHVEKVVDNTAGDRLGGPSGDDHAYVRIAGIADPVVIDSWVLFPKVHLASQGKYEVSEGHTDGMTYKVQDPDDKHSVPRDFACALDAIKSHKSDPELHGEDYYRDTRDHWFDLTRTRLRGWQLVQSQRDDVKETVYVCGDLEFDPDLMGASGLQLRKTWAQEAQFALEARGRALTPDGVPVRDMSPIRGAPDVGPLSRSERPLPPDTSKSIPGDSNPDSRDV